MEIDLQELRRFFVDDRGAVFCADTDERAELIRLCLSIDLPVSAREVLSDNWLVVALGEVHRDEIHFGDKTWLEKVERPKITYADLLQLCADGRMDADLPPLAALYSWMKG